MTNAKRASKPKTSAAKGSTAKPAAAAASTDGDIQALLSASMDGMAVLDEKGVCLAVNDVHARMHGYASGAQLAGRGYRDLLPADELIRFDKEIMFAFARDQRWRGESSGKRRDGTVFPQELSLSKVPGTKQGFVIVARDITERKRAELEHSQLLQLEKTARAEAEAASRAKDEFLAVVSHELRTPMTAVLGWTWLLRSGDVAPEERDKALDVIDRNMKMQAQIIEDLLDVSSIVTGKLHLDFKPVELGPLLRTSIDSVLATAEKSGITVDAEVSAAVTVSADAHRLKQVFWNLLSNALKFNKEGGRARVLLTVDAGCAAITVEDSGQGIDPAVLPEIFDPFCQAEESLTRQHRGLGLGLAIVRHLVELHGGSVSASSAGEGKGSSFTVLLPLLPAAETQPPTLSDKRRAIEGALPSVRVMIVDDEPDSVSVFTELLKQCGALVTSATSAREAFEKISRSMPQLLISDLAMPLEDGYSLIKKVRALSGGRAVRALALSARGGDEDRQRAVEAGFDRFLSKPVDLVHLVNVLREMHSETT
jgi:PAS domain S-box-containing protein